MSMSSKISILFQEEEVIANKSQSVIINQEGVKKLAKEVITWNYPQKEFDIEKKCIRYSCDFPQCYDYRSADWLFVLNTLNFPLCVLRDIKQWTVNGFTGYPALCSAMKRAITKEKKSIWNPRYYVNMKIDEMKELFRGDDGTCIPMIDTRLKILHDVGRILIDEYDGTFLTCIKLCNYNANLLMLLLTTKFECYQDAAITKWKRLNIKAKILINDLRSYFPINITTCVMIPMIFADYRSLDILFQYNALCYNETFKETLKTCDDSVISQYHDITKELELRCCAIVAVKMVYKEIQDDLEFLQILFDKLKNVELFNISIMVDNFFFQKFQELQHTKIEPE